MVNVGGRLKYTTTTYNKSNNNNNNDTHNIKIITITMIERWRKRRKRLGGGVDGHVVAVEVPVVVDVQNGVVEDISRQEDYVCSHEITFILINH